MAFLDAIPNGAWAWLGGSLLLAVFWTNLAWLFSPWVEQEGTAGEFGSLAERIVFTVATWDFASTAFQALRLLYYVGIPFAALFWGRDAIIRRFFGLQRLLLPSSEGGVQQNLISSNWFDWLQDAGWAAALGVGSWGLLLLAGWARRRAVGNEAKDGKTRGWETAREATYHEIHWAFYRNAPIAAFGLYRGVWIGLILVALEALANPRWRRGLTDPGRTPGLLLRAALAVVSSMLFLQTENLWLALLLHGSVAWGLAGMYGLTTSRLSDAVSRES